MSSGYLQLATAHLGEHSIRNAAIVSVLVVLVYRALKFLLAWRILGKAYEVNCCERPPMYPHKDPIFGIDILFANIKSARNNRFISASAQRFQDLGANTYCTWIQGHQTIHTIEPENVKTIMATKWKDYSVHGRKPNLGRLLGRGIFVATGEDWSHARSLLRPNFAKDNVADLDMLEGHLQELLKLLPRDPSQVVDMEKFFLRLTLDSATEFLFGHSTNTLAEPSDDDKAFSEAFRYALSSISTQIRRGPLHPFYPKDHKFDEANKTIREFIGRYIDEALERRRKINAGEIDKESEEANPQRYYFLQEVTKVMDDREHICDEVLSMMAAGRDTTASLMASAFYTLSRRPDIWKKLQNEIQFLNGHPPSYQQLRDLKYTKYIMNETLRMYPPIFSLGRRSLCDTILPTGGGADGTSPIFVPKGCGVIYNTWAMHRRKDLYGEDADEFRPERWAEKRHGWDYVPFGGGPRICLGQQYALTEAMYMMVRLAQEYASIVSADNNPWVEDIAITVSPKDGVNCRLTRA
ncbi:hypothetical protein NLG97_g2952 [Lecanicillium saksenae]|uniref:Uncharacterized protein n=1 Tax=Lecanicillium saksenae TaxID=468837 RepID=A0ACC1QZF4_9HYPO|nr:hypothetical protein NLG97_g2952 [Lecanicillium saksenae]